MSFETLKATINSNIVSGLPDGIRADFENNPTLQDIVSAFGQDYIYMGSAGIGTSPRTDDNARMYISSGSGEFTAFRDSGNNAINISEGEIAILKGISGVYEKDVFFSGDTVNDAGSVRINDTGSLIQLQARYDGDWITISEFSYVGGDVTLQSVNTYNLNAGSVVIGDMVESSAHTEVNNYLCVDGEVLVSQNEYLYADDFVEDRLESTSGEYIPNTASNSLAEIGMDTINDKCVLYNEAITSKEDVIESIVPSSTDGDFDVTRSSYTNRVNRDGFIEQVPPNTASYNYDSGDTRPHLLTEAASTNIITYPKSFGNSYWTKSGASIEGDSTLTQTGTDVASGWDFTSGWTASGTATIDSATSFTLNAASDYVNKKYNTLTGDAVLIRIIGTKDGGTLYIKDKDGTSGSIYAITDNSFDVTFWMNYESSREPIMFEAADANVGQVNITTMEFYEAQGFAAPKVDGSGGFEREAYKLVEDASADSHDIYALFGNPYGVGATYTYSIYAKAGERSKLGFRENSQTGYYGAVDLSDSTTLDTDSTSVNMTELSGGWWRVSFTAVSGGNGNTGCKLYLLSDSYSSGDPSHSNQRYSGDGTSGLYIAYTQLEESSYASSLMLPVTEGSTTTRVSDVVANAGNSALFSGINSSGVLYAEIAANSDEGFYRNISLNDGTSNNRISIYYSSPANNKIRVITKVGNSDQADLNQTLNVTEFSKIGFRWAENDFSLWVDGVEVDTDTSGSTWGSGVFTTLTFSGYGSTYPFYGKTKALGVFDYLSDYEMIRLTK